MHKRKRAKDKKNEEFRKFDMKRTFTFRCIFMYLLPQFQNDDQ